MRAAAALTLASILFAATSASASQGEFALITEWTIPAPAFNPGWMDVDASGAAWFTGYYNGQVARLDPTTSSLTVWQHPTGAKNLEGIAADSMGGAWYSTYSGEFVHLDSAGQFTVWTVPGGVGPFLVDYSGKLFFGEYATAGNAIGMFDPTNGTLTSWKLPNASSKPEGVVRAGNGMVWFGENAGRIGRLDPLTGVITEWALPSPVGERVYVHVDGNGMVWSNGYGSNRVVRLDPSLNTITTWPVPTPSAGLFDVTEDGSGKLWFAESLSNKVARFDPLLAPPNAPVFVAPVSTPPSSPAPTSLASTSYSAAPTVTVLTSFTTATMSVDTPPFSEWTLQAGQAPSLLDFDPNERLFFTEFLGNKIGMLILDADGDGVADSLDPCPNDFADDSDGDGTCDSADVCPADVGNDGDGDGVCESVDDCPIDYNPSQNDGDGNGAGDACDPVCLDFQRGVGGNVIDSWTNSGQPTTNFGTGTTLNTGVFGGTTRRAYLQWDVSAIPANAVIQSATLTLFQTASTGPANLSLLRSNGTWTETGLTFANQSTVVVPPVSTTTVLGAPTNVYFSFDLATLVQQWVNGTYVNKGVAIQQGGGNAALFSSSDAATPANRPAIDICYVIPG
jgi:streptogramin lyase